MVMPWIMMVAGWAAFLAFVFSPSSMTIFTLLAITFVYWICEANEMV